MSDSPAPERKGGRGGTRVPVLIALLVAGGLVAAYWLYVREQREYYVHRNLRMLATLSRQIDGAFTTQEGFLHNYAFATDGWSATQREGLLHGFDRQPCSEETLKHVGAMREQVARNPGHELFRRAIRSREGESWVEISWAGMVPKSGQTTEEATAYCRQMPLSKVLELLVVSRDSLVAFDAVFLANAKGRVLYSYAPKQTPSTLLWSAVENEQRLHAGGIVASNLVLTSLGSMERATGLLGRERKPLDPIALRDATRHLEVQVADEPYVLFTQPYAFHHPSVAGGQKSDEDAWVVGGIVARQRFRSDVAAISASKAALAVALCVLAVCAWPFLRISLMTERQPMTITDVALLVVCSFVAVMLLMVTILNWLGYERLTIQTDNQLRAFSRKLEQDFTRNVIAASKTLDAVQAWTFQPRKDDAGNPVPRPDNEWSLLLDADRPDTDAAKLFDHPDVRNYPYFTSFAWIDEKGQQQYKASTTSRLPLVNVADRRYFRNARRRTTWDARPKPDGREQYPYALEWVQSLTTGETEAVLAKPTGDSELPVAALTTKLIDVSLAIPPPGVQFAIVDEQGNVIYHSDEQRIRREDFFAETDNDRELRAAVLGRTDAFVTASYWGEDQRVFVHPMANTPWSLLTFRSKRLVRAINIEALLLTMVALFVNGLPYVLFGAVILVIAPWYRAPSLWPDPSRRSDYVRLVTVLALAAVTLALGIYALQPESILPIIVIVPVQALLSCYVLLHRHDRRRVSLFAFAAWLTITAVLVAFIGTAKVDVDLLVSETPGRVRWLLLAVVLFKTVVALKLMTRKSDELDDSAAASRLAFLKPILAGANRLAAAVPSVRYPGSYKLTGVLVLVVCAVLPTIGYFKLGSRYEQNALVKYAQLRLAAQVENRINTIGRMVCHGQRCLDSPAARRDALHYRIANVWDTLWSLEDKPRLRDRTGVTHVHEGVMNLIPEYSEDSVAMRQLYTDGSADLLWSWRQEGRLVTLDRLVRLDVGASQALFGVDNVRQQVLRFSSYVPLLFPSAFSSENTRRYVVSPSALDAPPASGAVGLAYTLLCAALVVAFAAVLFWIVRFFTERVLLLGVQEPLWLGERGAVLGDHVFLTRRDEPLENVLGPRDPLLFADVHLSALDRDSSWEATLRDLDQRPIPTVRVVDFEYALDDETVSAKKLDFLEKLVARHDCRVLVISESSPSYFLHRVTRGGDAASPESRWKALFAQFLTVTWEELQFRRSERERLVKQREGGGEHWTLQSMVRVVRDWQGTVAEERRRTAQLWLEEETATSPYLRRLAAQLEATADREQILDELRERAEAYYGTLWSSCTEDEKLLCFHLARHGFVHARNRRTLRRLIARGLVRRSPNLELMSESFRHYVLAAAAQENLLEKVKEIANEGVWKTLRVPLFIVLTSFLLLLFTTQKDLLTVTTGLAAAITTGLPVLVNLFGVFTQKRLESASKTR